MREDAVCDRQLGANHTSSIMAKFGQNINMSFYIHYTAVAHNAYVLVNNETTNRPRLSLCDLVAQSAE